MKCCMTGKERALRALDFEPTDRLPVVGGFIRHPEFIAKAAGVSRDEFWKEPQTTAIRAYRNIGVDAIVGLILPNSEHANDNAVYGSPKQERFSSPEDIIAEISQLPSLETLSAGFDFQHHYQDYLERYTKGQARIGDDILWIPSTFDCVASFQNEGYYGAENYYMALSLYPEEMNRFFEYSGKQAFLRNTAVARAIIEHDLPRVMWMGQDMCDNRGPYIAPEALSNIYIRHMKHSLEPLKYAGIKIIWHSDGNIMPIVKYLIDAGIDGFQGMQETIEKKIDIEKLGDMNMSSGRKPIIMGSVSSTTVMPFGSQDDVRTDVLRCQHLAKKRGGGWLLNFSSSIGPEVPVENIKAFYETSLEPGFMY